MIKKNNSYLAIITEKFRFLDICNFLSPGVSYSAFLKAFNIETKKSFFCYDYLDSYDKLSEKSLPSHESFYSELKRENISLEDYQSLEQIWKENNMKTLKDLLVYYNNLDVTPFVLGIEKMQQFYFEKKVDLFKDAFSVPGIARKLLFKTAVKQKVVFPLFSSENESTYKKVKSGLVGGPSLIFCRYQSENETYVRPDFKKLTKSIVGYDANSLYLYCIGKQMPHGNFIIRKRENDFLPKKHSKFSLAEIWMEWKSSELNIEIYHARNYGKQKRVCGFLVDGFCADNKQVFEFNGCFFHGCECMKGKMDESLRQVREEKTIRRKQFLENEGYSVIAEKECEFRKKIEQDKNLKHFCSSFFPSFYNKFPKQVTESEILKSVENGLFFGMLQVDITTPEFWPYGKQKSHLSPKEYFSEMCPLFSTVEVRMDEIGQHMKQHIKENQLSLNPRKLLISGLSGKKLMIISPLLQWYIKHGLIVTKIHEIIEFRSSDCFKEFTEEVTKARRIGDSLPNQSVLSDCMKIIGNSAFGGLIMDKMKHTSISFKRTKTEAVSLINSYRFVKLSEFGENSFEIEQKKKVIQLDMPIYLGAFVLGYGKMHMLDYYYNYLDYFLNRMDYIPICMDTDSIYISISSENFYDIVKEEKKKEYLDQIYNNCKSVQTNFLFPARQCCDYHVLYDKRRLGCFKVEAQGRKIIALNSKTYCLEKQDSTSKFSCKGLNKKHLGNPYDIYHKVLFEKKDIGVENIGLRCYKSTIFTYKQHRIGFSYFYCKREVLDCGILTKPLNKILDPWDLE